MIDKQGEHEAFHPQAHKRILFPIISRKSAIFAENARKNRILRRQILLCSPGWIAVQ